MLLPVLRHGPLISLGDEKLLHDMVVMQLLLLIHKPHLES
jgi:hypothetical protein